MNDFDTRMAELRVRFAARAAGQRAELESALAAGHRDELRRLAHSLAGSAGIFGFPQISADARALEEAVDEGATMDELRRLAALLLERLTGA